MNTPATLQLFGSLIQLRVGGSAEPSSRHSHDDSGLWSVAAFHAEDDQALHSHVWERHLSGQEVLCVLSGAINVYLRGHDIGSRPTATLTAGEGFIVPVGQWHRLTVSEPGDLLAITPRRSTEHEQVAAADRTCL